MSNPKFTILVDGNIYTGIESARVESNFLKGSTSGHIALPPKDYGSPYPIKANMPVQIFINSIPVMNGYIDALQATISMNGMLITATIRDKTGDLIDSTLNPYPPVDNKKKIKLQKFIQQYVDALGVEMVVFDNSIDKPWVEKDENITVEPGDSYFSYLTKYAHAKGCIIRSNGKGSIVIEQGSTGNIKTPLGVKVIKNSKLAIDMSSRFYKYCCIVQSNDGTQEYGALSLAANQTKDVTKPVVTKNKDGTVTSIWKDGTIMVEATDPGVEWGGTRKSRYYAFISEASVTAKDAQTEVKWTANYRRSNSLTYSCTVGGFEPIKDKGEIWGVGKLVNVNDIAYGITMPMMINKAVYNIDVNGGSTTDLELLTSDAFRLNVTKAAKLDKKPDSSNFNGLLDISKAK